MLERELIPQVIELLRDAYTIKNNVNECDCYAMTEFFVKKMKLLEVNIEMVAFEIAHQKAEIIVPYLKFYDYKGAQKLEQMLQYI
ncbi:hypothetical protein [Alkalihalobacillus sp. R86527]|uniref:hypothetical protein n=1 Tax=Alkalihalobacillus sp. R86527 TaxID=3093863 RepID=UPI00366B3CF6